MIIGAPHRTDLTGRAYLYKKDYKSRWQLIETIVPEKNNWSSDFGSQVAINDRHILIADRNVEREKGAVFSMKLNPNTNEWEIGTTLSYPNMKEHGFFGHSIALKNDRTVIGSRNGNVAASFPVNEGDEIILSTDKGRVMRCAVKEIRSAGRNTQGVRIITLSGEEKVVSAIKVDDNFV